MLTTDQARQLAAIDPDSPTWLALSRYVSRLVDELTEQCCDPSTVEADRKAAATSLQLLRGILDLPGEVAAALPKVAHQAMRQGGGY